MRSLRLWAVLVGALWLAWAGGVGVAVAEEVSTEEFETLIHRAGTDDQALAELRDVDAVDGVPADVAGALQGADDEELRERLEALASNDEEDSAADPSAARSQAQSIVTEEEYQPRQVPAPLRRVGEWIEERLEGLERVFDRVASHLPGRRATLWVILAVAVVAAAAFVVAKTTARRAPIDSRPQPQRRGRPLDPPTALEREADNAESRGDLVRAIRLRFKAGLLRLDEVGVITFRPSITSREVARSVRSPIFERLAATFDEVVYGGRAPKTDDVGEARDGWALLTKRARAT